MSHIINHLFYITPKSLINNILFTLSFIKLNSEASVTWEVAVTHFK